MITGWNKFSPIKNTSQTHSMHNSYAYLRVQTVPRCCSGDFYLVSTSESYTYRYSQAFLLFASTCCEWMLNINAIWLLSPSSWLLHPCTCSGSFSTFHLGWLRIRLLVHSLRKQNLDSQAVDKVMNFNWCNKSQSQRSVEGVSPFKEKVDSRARKCLRSANFNNGTPVGGCQDSVVIQ